MKPNSLLISITDNLSLIHEFLREIIVLPRINIIKWSRITNQTPNLKIGYPAQHLASLITGVKGTATGARGDDLCDKTEVKACSRIDPLDKCKKCGSNVMRSQRTCSHCGAEDIKRTNDSKWLIGIRSPSELSMYLNDIPRTLFIISDYPEFEQANYSKIRIASYEIWNQSDRAKNFRTLLKDYYNKIYLEHIKKNPNKTPAPKNFWPYSYQFYMSNPIKTFECEIVGVNSDDFKIDIKHYIAPEIDRSVLESEPMPISCLKANEMDVIRRRFGDVGEYITEKERMVLSLRDTSKAVPHKSEYHRGE